MALAPEWMSYTKDVSAFQGPRILARERERTPKYGRQLSHSNFSYSYQTSHADTYDRKVPSTPFACSLSPPAPPHAPSPPILGDPPSRVLNRSKSSPGFGSPKSNKPKKSPDRNFPSFKQPKPKPPKPSFSPANYSKSHSQPNLFTNEKTTNWHQQKLQHSTSSSNVPSTPSPLATSTTVASPPPSHPPSTSPPPLPPSSSPPLVVVPEIDKLKQLIPNTGMPPKSVRARGVVGPPLPLTKKHPPSISSVAPASPSTLQSPPSVSPVSGAAPSLAAYFRKATSEPSLMHHKAQGAQATDPATVSARRDAKSKKARAMESEKAQAQLLREAVAAKQPKKSSFFQHLIKKEENGELLLEDDTPIGGDQSAAAATAPPEPYSPPLSPPLSPPPSSPPIGLRSPLPEDMEDEERLLREMGWVPDEEDPVPVLAEEEIADVRVKIILSKQAQRARHEGVPLSIDVDVK